MKMVDLFSPDPFLSLIYPQACKLCGKSVEHLSDGVVCADCWQKSGIFTGAEKLCAKCSALLAMEGGGTETARCRKCDEHYYEKARAAGAYENALMASILRLKEKPHLPKRLAALLAKTFYQAEFSSTITLIIPVPLSKPRQKERGFNQAAIIAATLAKLTGLKTDDKSLRRKLHTEKHRVGMDRKARMESVRNAFEVTRPRLIAGEIVLLVDDIFTTGATASNCAGVLKKNGADKVYVLTIARAI